MLSSVYQLDDDLFERLFAIENFIISSSIFQLSSSLHLQAYYIYLMMVLYNHQKWLQDFFSKPRIAINELYCISFTNHQDFYKNSPFRNK